MHVRDGTFWRSRWRRAWRAGAHGPSPGLARPQAWPGKRPAQAGLSPSPVSSAPVGDVPADVPVESLRQGSGRGAVSTFRWVRFPGPRLRTGHARSHASGSPRARASGSGEGGACSSRCRSWPPSTPATSWLITESDTHLLPLRAGQLHRQALHLDQPGRALLVGRLAQRGQIVRVHPEGRRHGLHRLPGWASATKLAVPGCHQTV
jgi:hypothetical protein